MSELVRKAIIVLAVVCAASCELQATPADTLKYDDAIILDAEDLCEIGVAEGYQDVLPQLKTFVPRPLQVTDVRSPTTYDYSVEVDGKRYEIYASNTETSIDACWRSATYALFRIVNDQLVNSEVNFYALYDGNDLVGMFLSPQTVREFKRSTNNEYEWPYLPEFETK